MTLFMTWQDEFHEKYVMKLGNTVIERFRHCLHVERPVDDEAQTSHGAT